MSLRVPFIIAALLACPDWPGCGQPAAASGADTGQPSACRPANHRGVITPDDPDAGHLHYRVTLTAAPGFEPCTLVGAPTQVTFRGPDGTPLNVEATVAADPGSPVPFGPGRDVHFDIAVRNQPGGARAASVTFVLHTPEGEIPGEQEASGGLQVDVGTQVGPVQAG